MRPTVRKALDVVIAIVTPAAMLGMCSYCEPRPEAPDYGLAPDGEPAIVVWHPAQAAKWCPHGYEVLARDATGVDGTRSFIRCREPR